jgi:hypothetical protein
MLPRTDPPTVGNFERIKHTMMILKKFGIALLAFLALPGIASAQKWQPLKHPGTYSGVGAMLLLTDGTVLLHEEQSNAQNWYKLTPDNTGSYINGTIKLIATMPSGYAPLFFGSVVLPDGQMIIEGGEYNEGNSAWTTLGAIYNPDKDKWTSVNPPSGWSSIGDAQATLLNNGIYMQANCCDTEQAYFNPKTLGWTNITNTGKTDRFDEEGWTLLPNGEVLTTDAINAPHYEIYNPKTKKWTTPGTTPVLLEDPNSQEIGPMVLRPDGTVFASGAAPAGGTGHTAIYNSKTGKWKAGPDFSSGLACDDAPAALETNGNVVVMTSPPVFNTGAVFFEWNGKKLAKVAGPPNASGDAAFYGHFLELPTGQLLFSDLSTDVEVFTPKGTYKKAWAPTITSVPSTVTHGQTYVVKGTQFNGQSQGGAYGDDFQDATNYGLVRITNNATKHVFYAKTHNPSTMAVATGSKPVSTKFDVPTGIETGASTLEVVANGIPSAGIAVTVQ